MRIPPRIKQYAIIERGKDKTFAVFDMGNSDLAQGRIDIVAGPFANMKDALSWVDTQLQHDRENMNGRRTW